MSDFLIRSHFIILAILISFNASAQRACVEVLAVSESPKSEGLSELTPFTLRLHQSMNNPDSAPVLRALDRMMNDVEAIFLQSGQRKSEKITAVNVEINKQYYNIRVIDLEKSEYAVRPLTTGGFAVETKNIRSPNSALAGGLSKKFYISERNLKEKLSLIKSESIDQIVAASVEVKQDGFDIPVFVVYRDTKKKLKDGGFDIQRDILEITYPRDYRISKKNVIAMQSRHNILLSDLDYIFNAWDGNAYLPKLANRIFVKGDVDGNPDIYWFIGEHESGQKIQFFVSMGPGQSLPTIVAWYLLTPEQVSDLQAKIASQAPKRIFN